MPHHDGGIKHRLTVFEEGLMWPCHLIETRIDIESEAEQAMLVSGTQVMTTQIRPCTLRVSIKDVEHIVKFPYPIRGTMVKSRVDYESHQVYLIIPPLKVLESGGYPTNLFPLLQHTNYSPWNLHHIHLDRMPKLDLRNTIRNPNKFQWLIEHTTSQMSNREQFVRHCTNPVKRRPSDVLVNIKETITTLIQVYAGLRQARRVVFTLHESSRGIYMAICIGGLRLDLTAATVVLDVAAVPWSPEVEKLLDPATLVHEIHTPANDVPIWKHLVTACVERCRTWLHGLNCEYKSAGGAPRLHNAECNPLCSCGQGLGFESGDWKVALWERLLPYATRAAISPLFGVSYLEEILGPGLALQGTQQPASWDEPTNKCWMCGHPAKNLMGCQQCKKSRYCSKECQGRHWKAEHKYVCKSPNDPGDHKPVYLVVP
ncbi:hypothetical protein FRC12_004728 [Ceratobasidium sp. 428]|nr:hypothetical protein FRC12_004728 [Ceratobasidium sp. 428]